MKRRLFFIAGTVSCLILCVVLMTALPQPSLSSTEAAALTIAEWGGVGIGIEPQYLLHVAKSMKVEDGIDCDFIRADWVQARKYVTTSSKRWKTNIQTIDNAIDIVRRLRGVRYDWKVDGQADIGLIAEELAEVLPELVTYEENGVDAKAVEYAKLVAILIEAVKHQQNQLEYLRAQNAEFQAFMERSTR